MHTTDIRDDVGAVPRLPAWMAGFGCGLLTGAALGILFAPARGRAVRREIAWSARKGYDQASRLVDRGRRAAARQKDRVDDLVQAVGQHAGEIQAGVASAMHETKAAFGRGRQQSLDR